MKTQAVCVYFVWQEVSSSRELIWRRTWNTSAPTRQSRWRTWWCPRTRRCSAGWRSRRPAPESAHSTSSPGTLSPRATLYRPSSNWMRNYWNGPRDFPPRICIILPLKKKKKKKKCESQHEIHSSLFFFFFIIVTEKKVLESFIVMWMHLSEAVKCTFQSGSCLKKKKKNRLSGIFDLHLFVYIQFTIYAMYCIGCHEAGEVAGFMLRWPKQ